MTLFCNGGGATVVVCTGCATEAALGSAHLGDLTSSYQVAYIIMCSTAVLELGSGNSQCSPDFSAKFLSPEVSPCSSAPARPQDAQALGA